MRDHRLRQLLSVLPEEAETRARAARACGRALARMDSTPPALRWRWIPALAMLAVAGIGTAWVIRRWQVDPLALRPPVPAIAQAPVTLKSRPAPATRPARRVRPQQDRLQVQFVLSDGTRVQWIFDKDFSL